MGRGGAGLRRAKVRAHAPARPGPFPSGARIQAVPSASRPSLAPPLCSRWFRRRARHPRPRRGEAAIPGANQRLGRWRPLPRRLGARSGRFGRPRGGAGHSAEPLGLSRRFAQPGVGAALWRPARPLYPRPKGNFGVPEVRAEGVIVDFRCAVSRSRSRKRDVEAASQTSQTR